MRLAPWKLAGLVLLVVVAHDVAVPEVAHAPGVHADSAPAPQPTQTIAPLVPPVPVDPQRDEAR